MSVFGNVDCKGIVSFIEAPVYGGIEPGALDFTTCPFHGELP